MSPSATSPATRTSGVRRAATQTGRSGRSGGFMASRPKSSRQKSPSKRPIRRAWPETTALMMRVASSRRATGRS